MFKEGYNQPKKEAGWEDTIREDPDSDRYIVDEKLSEELVRQEERQNEARELLNNKEITEALNILDTLDQNAALPEDARVHFRNILIKVLRDRGVEYAGPTLH